MAAKCAHEVDKLRNACTFSEHIKTRSSPPHFRLRKQESVSCKNNSETICFLLFSKVYSVTIVTSTLSETQSSTWFWWTIEKVIMVRCSFDCEVWFEKRIELNCFFLTIIVCCQICHFTLGKLTRPQVSLKKNEHLRHERMKMTCAVRMAELITLKVSFPQLFTIVILQDCHINTDV